MIKSTILSLLLCAVILSAHADEGYVIKGTIKGDYVGYIYLSYENTKDSALVQNNAFEFKGTIDKPVLAWMNLKPDANVAWIFLENSAITIEGSFSTAIQENQKMINLYHVSSITGSYSQALWDRYKVFYAANEEKENFNALRFQELKFMFTENPKSPVNGWILGNLATNSPVFTYEEFTELYSMLDTAAMQRSDLRMIKTGLLTMTKYGVGQPFPIFELSNQHDKPVKSSKFYGKIVLIDFWASWCGPCRAKHPALVELQKKYQDKNFKVVSITVDKDRNAWNKAIIKDNLTWDNLYDTDSKISNELGIQAIPFNYLLDEQGNIFAINQSLEKIDKILQEKLK